MDLGPHASFIWICYAVVGLVVAGLVGYLAADGARLRRELADLEAQAGGRHAASHQTESQS